MSLKNLSATAGSNTLAPPYGAPESSTKLKDYNDCWRYLASVVRHLASPATVASAATTDLGASDETWLTISGTTTITSFGTVSAGIYKFVTFSGALTLTHNATSLILLGEANRTTVAGDCGLYVSLGGGNWKEYFYSPIGAYQPLNSTLTAISNRSLGPFAHRNKIINGGFDIWQRGTSQTTDGYGSVDRWYCGSGGSTKTASQQTFTLGQTDVPGEPKFFMRHVVTSVTGASNLVYMAQHIEDVRTFAGKNVTITFYAKADAAKNIAIEFSQSFGTGGTPSTSVDVIGSQLIALTTTWQKFTRTIAIPSISGKTLGTNNNDYLRLLFWFDAGTTFNTRTATLGQQSGTFDIAQVQVEEGSVATPFEQRPIGYELSLCQRYFEKSYADAVAPGAAIVDGSYHSVASTTYILSSGSIPFSTKKRATPSVTLYSPASGAAGVGAEYNSGSTYVADRASTTIAGASGFEVSANGTATTGNFLRYHWTAIAEL